MDKVETYRTKTIKVGDAVVRIHQPILSEQERLKREDTLKKALANYGKLLEGVKQ